MPGALETAATASAWISLVAPEVMPERETTRGGELGLRTRSGIGSRVGAWLTRRTFRRKALLALEALPSCTVKVIVAAPDWLVAGRMVTVRLLPVPPNVMLVSGTKVRSEETADRVRLAGGVSKSFTTKGIGAVAVSWGVVWSAMAEMVGGSFTGVTVRRKERVALVRPSLTVSVILFVPFWLLSGVMAKTRFVPLPPTTRLASGISAEFVECAVTIRLPAGVSTSETVNGTNNTGPSSIMVWSAMLEMRGASFTALTES